MKTDYLRKILAARVYDVAIESPLELAPAISRRTGNHILLKREDKQPVFSFKLRGAYNKMAHLTPAQLARGVICASAGNHAQGVALGAQKLGDDGHHRDAGDHAAHQGLGGGRARRQGGAARRQLPRGRAAREGAREEAGPHLRAPLRRSARHRRAGHHRHGDPAPAPAAHRRHLRAGGRRRADRGHRRLREAAFARDPHHRRGAGGLERHDGLAQGGPARDAAAREHLRRRRGGAAGGARDLPAVPRAGRRDGARRHRRDLRGHQGHLRGHAHGGGALRARWRSPAPSAGWPGAGSRARPWWRSPAAPT